MSAQSVPRIVPAGDSAIVVEFEERVDLEVNARAIRMAASITARQLSGVKDVVPTYRSVAVHFDPLHVDYDSLIEHIESGYGATTAPRAEPAAPIRIPVCYGGEWGPDLPDVATFAGVSEDEVVRLHTSTTYHVFMLGFVAGFAYLGSVDARIAMPRHQTPRVRVPLGSVGIAGAQTGVYPAETPGGWRLIGRTPVLPFDLDRAEPFLLKAGDSVHFHAISRAEYEAWRSS